MKKRKWKRKGRFVNHHNINKCKNGRSSSPNLIRMDESREKAWHFLFHNLSFKEVAELLIRLDRMKNKSYKKRLK